jgi:hypothetical protein
MTIQIRDAVLYDAPACGRVLFAAFQTLADQHGFPRDFPSAEVASGLAAMLLVVSRQRSAIGDAMDAHEHRPV